MSTIDSSDIFLPEFKASAIRDDVVALNIRILGDTSYVAEGQDLNEDLDFLIDRLNLDGGSKVDRNNPGRISTSSLNYARKMCGGWYNAPFFGLAEKAEIDYFCFKPNVPPKDYKGKVFKYVGAAGVSPRLMTPNVPQSIWAVIACRYNVEKTGDNFWEWILDHPQIPVVITEGLKKGLAGISAEYPVAAINGCHGGFISIKEDDGTLQGHQLIPDLQALAKGGRTIYIALDRDSSRKTQRTVQGATKVLAGLFAEQECEVYSIKWDSSLYKGLDDFIAGAGLEALKLAIENATNITPQLKSKKDEEKNKLPPLLEVAAIVVERVFKDVKYESSVGQWWIYDGHGKWEIGCDVDIFKLVQDFLDETLSSFTPGYVESIIKFARSSCLVRNWQETSSTEFLPFKNGVLNLKTKEILPHSRDYYFTWQLPRDYSILSTDWHPIGNFLDILTGFNPDLKNIAIAYCYAVLKGRSDLQQFLFLSGTGGNGKGAFLNLLEMLIGTENVHSTTLPTLCENRFETENLRGMRLVIFADEAPYPGNLGVFLKLTGQDGVRSEAKGKKAGKFKYTGMVAMAANRPVFMGNGGYAVDRRKIDFPCIVTVNKADRRDLTPEFKFALPAFTNYLLELSDEWVTDIFVQAKDVDAVKALGWEQMCREDNVVAFFDDCIVIDPESNVPGGTLYAHYTKYCDDNGLRAKGQPSFSPSLMELCTTRLNHKVTVVKTRTTRNWEGLRLRTSLEICSKGSVVKDVPMQKGMEKCGEGGDSVAIGVAKQKPPCESGVAKVAKQTENSVQTEENKVVEGVANSYYSETFNLTSGADKAFASPPSPHLPQPSDSNGSSRGEASNCIATLSPPSPQEALKVGDKVKYVGTNVSLQKQYAGVLEVKVIDPIEGYACWTPDKKGLTTWLQASDLRLVKG